MLVIVATLFLLAICASALAIFGTISNSMPRIIEVLDSRGKPALRSRTIHIGALRSTVASSNAAGNAAALTTRPRLVVNNNAPAMQVPGDADLGLPLAA